MSGDDVGDHLERIALTRALEALVERGEHDAGVARAAGERLVERTPPEEVLRLPREEPSRADTPSVEQGEQRVRISGANRRPERCADETAIACTGARERLVERAHRRREGARACGGDTGAPNADEVGCRRAARAEGADRLVDGRDRADPRRAASTAERREQRVLRSCAGTTEQVELRARSVRRHRVLERNGEREPRLAQIREADVGQQRRGEPSSKRRTRLSALSLASEPLDVSLCRNDDELVVSKSPQRRPWCHCKNRSGMPSAASNVFRS